MNTIDIRTLRKNGSSTWEILSDLIAEGTEYPDAVWAVTKALNLDSEQVEEMEDRYTNCI
jgi:hypothetical protein